MYSNPLDIQPGTFYISGPVQSPTGLPNAAFERVELALKKHGHLVFNPENNLHCKDRKTRLAFMVRCDHIVTLSEWASCPESIKEVQIARIVGIKVSLAEAFLFRDNEISHAGGDAQ